MNIVLADDPEAAWQVIKPHVAYQSMSYQRYAVEGTGRAAPAPVDPDVLRAGGGCTRFSGPFDVLTVQEAVAFVVDAVGELPVTDVFFWSSIAGMPDALVDRHVELVCGGLRQRLNQLMR
jgi:hypothetical protein